MNLFVELHNNPVVRKVMVPFECVQGSERKIFYISMAHLISLVPEYFSRIFFPTEYGYSDVLEPYELGLGETFAGVEEALQLLHDPNFQNVDVPEVSLHAAITLDKWMVNTTMLQVSRCDKDVPLPYTSEVIMYAAKHIHEKLNILIPDDYKHPLTNIYDLVFVLEYLPDQLDGLSSSDQSFIRQAKHRLSFWSIADRRDILFKIKIVESSF